MAKTHRFKAEIMRHHPKTPRFVLVPPSIPAALKQTATFVAEVRFDDLEPERKSIKPWGDGRWFMDVAQDICRRLRLDVGSTVAIAVAPVEEQLPEALSDAIRQAGATRAWFAQTPAQQRMIAEHIYGAKRTETMQRRVAAAIAVLKARPLKIR